MALAGHENTEMLPVKALFSYDELDADKTEKVQQLASRIRQRTVSMAQSYIDNGKDLLTAREFIPRGAWRLWINEEFNWTETTASTMMRIARLFGHLQLAESQVSIAALNLLAHYDVPSTIRVDAIRLIESGELIKSEDAAEFVAQTSPAMTPRFPSAVPMRNRQIVHEFALQVAEMSFAIRNMQMALSQCYGVPLRTDVANALERLQNTADILIRLVPTVSDRSHSRQGIKASDKGYVGVSFHRREQKWVATIIYKGKRYNLGRFDTEEAAARAYDAKARELYGDAARLNFPHEATP